MLFFHIMVIILWLHGLNFHHSRYRAEWKIKIAFLEKLTTFFKMNILTAVSFSYEGVRKK